MSTPSNHEHAHEKLCILIVEDDNLLQEMFRKALGSSHLLYITSNIKEGWTLYLDKAPNIIFLDVHLPDGSGHDLAHKIKLHNASSYIIMATASHRRDDKVTALHAQVDGYIIKPFNKKTMDDCVHQYLASITRPK